MSLRLSGHPEFLSLVVGQRLDRNAGADSRFHRADRGEEVHHVVFSEEIIKHLLSAPVVVPVNGVILAQAHRIGAEEIEGAVLAGPVARPVTAALHGPLGDRVEDRVGRNQLAGRRNGDLKATVAQFTDEFGKILVAFEQVDRRCPGADHLPFNRLIGGRGNPETHAENGYHHDGNHDTQSFLHDIPPCDC